MPSLAVLPAFLAAAASPFLRSASRAFSRSPPHSVSAALQSMIPAPVSSRSLRTISAEISIGSSVSRKKAPGSTCPGRARRCGLGRGSGHRYGSGHRPRPRLATGGLVLGGCYGLLGRRALGRPRPPPPPPPAHRPGHPAAEQLERAQGVVVR